MWYGGGQEEGVEQEGGHWACTRACVGELCWPAWLPARMRSNTSLGASFIPEERLVPTDSSSIDRTTHGHRQHALFTAALICGHDLGTLSRPPPESRHEAEQCCECSEQMLFGSKLLQELCADPLTPFRVPNQLYFYTEVGEEKCFIEELPVDTVVVGHYMAETWHADKNAYVIEEDMGIRVSVVVSRHRY